MTFRAPVHVRPARLAHRTLLAGAAALAITLALGACTGGADDRAKPLTAITSAPEAELTVVSATTESEASIQTSGQLFDSAPVVVLVTEGDAAAQRVAAEAAIGLGAPLLVTPAASTDDSGTDAPAADVPGADAPGT
ncbi:MAG: hypothetical protein ABWY54_08130, partial [Glaciihabitans sp.]